MKKTIAILLSVVMLLGCIGVAAVSAAETSVQGDILITNADKTYTAAKGATLTYSVYATTPEVVENGQYYITYPQNLLKVTKCSMPNTPGAMFNYDENLVDEIRLNFSNTNGCDMTTETLLIEVQFEVVGEGNGSIVFHPEVMCNLKDVSIVNQVIFRETIDGADVFTPTELPSTEPATDASDNTDPTPGVTQPSDVQQPTTEPADPTTTEPTSPPSNEQDHGNTEPTISLGPIGDEDPKGSTFNLLQVKNTSTTKNSVKLSYKKPGSTYKFIIYGSQCGKKYNKLKETTKKTYTATKLKKGKYYKFLVVALDKKNKVVAISKTIHVATKGGKWGNPNKVKITNATAAKTLKLNKTIKLKTKVTAAKGVKFKNHRDIAFESSNTKILKVNSKGKVTAKKKGTATIYAYAQNGVMAKVKIKVK